MASITISTEELEEMLLDAMHEAIQKHKESHSQAEPHPWMTIEDAAVHLGLSKHSMRRAIRKAESEPGLNPVVWFTPANGGALRIHVKRYWLWAQYKDQPNFHNQWLWKWLEEDTPGSRAVHNIH